MFKRAVRAGVPMVIGIVSKTGRGKTRSALRLARGLVGPNGKIVAIDTEAGRLRYHSGVTEFYCDELAAPYSPARYVEKIHEAIKEGADCILIDQVSFEWAGTGGVLEMADDNGKKGALKWAGPKTQHRKFMNALAESRAHVIVTVRAVDEIDWDAPKPMKTGNILPIQNDQFMYEMTISLMLNDEGNRGVPTMIKCDGELEHCFPPGAQLTERTGEMLADYVKGGAPVDHAFEALKAQAREQALEGTKAFKAWILGAGIQKELWVKLKPLVDTELASAARAADDMAASKSTETPVSDTSILADGPKP